MPYNPISCSLYDHLEVFAMREQVVEIALRSGEIFAATINTLETRKDDGEYLILQSGREIRLDELESVNGILFESAC